MNLRHFVTLPRTLENSCLHVFLAEKLVTAVRYVLYMHIYLFMCVFYRNIVKNSELRKSVTHARCCEF
jgi:hypothetical protein